MRRRWWFVGALLGVVGIAVYRRVVRPWHLTWGATNEETAAPLVGDDLVAEPARQCTRGITIDAPPDAVWPWVVQIGADRGGFYSYDWLENLFGLGIHSADRVVSEWQHREVGDLVYADASGSGGWYVMEVRPNEVLVLKVADVASGHPVRHDEPPWWEFAWTFALREAPTGRTRLLVRERVSFGKNVMRLAMAPVGVVSFVMTRRTMLGIKERAEGAVGRDPLRPGPAVSIAT